MSVQHQPSHPALGHRSQPTAAGVYDWCLRGRHHLPCDADAAIAAQRLFPLAGRTAQYNRDFLRRAVRWLVTDGGIRQFLDIGSGYPTAGNVHEIARTHAPDTRVVYVDLDPDTVAVSNRLLAQDPDTVCLQGDLRDPDNIFGQPQIELLNLDQPIALLLVSVLPFVAGDATSLIRRYTTRLARGSYLAITHITPPEDERTRRQQAELAKTYNAVVQQTAHLRTRDQITDLFAGTELIHPGLVRATDWQPPQGYQPDLSDQAAAVILGGVARIP
ncbi:SAM-dependent methyltransferase [Amycolatopsis sp. GM8]|uniref:SAM-dependent methyltransferase n=1 Tax=Amycolatopsis sp. GM8 TaxID=2896530 RepID=UPI001F15A645|nr:SAM-dependent methyltransferase [Amycolatopsis sp. GM8]